ncbi:hypothetical protein [Corynebacterium cystitidis]|uniref:Uncharacterized protein n=1 Tax=Corynebacterium cystitidis DSM 20524 TaxID=1121357 RepID=A0A1H9QMN6_9CORY|nr:hypothetical protein [Corynebacterium cystitidis]WJY81720.1 hypothetical protein CCYS_03790 [Corynebacterium cystitidis DSM 20524]SER61722.1 hypothetical protein SAMN05661109_00607 [Corynebacterium cystitidis DSM 20524]SNV84477.1 Uncharacterised protein [Corynebacterium cystitidis]
MTRSKDSRHTEETKETPPLNLRLTALVVLLVVGACSVAIWAQPEDTSVITSILLLVALGLLIWFVWMPIYKGFLPSALLMTGAMILWAAGGSSAVADVSGNMLVGFGIITLGQRLGEAARILPSAYR